MRPLLAAVRRRWLAMTGLVALWVVTVAIGGPVLYGLLMLTAGIVGALAGPAHPIRNGTLAGILVLLSGVIALGVAVGAGVFVYPEGESAQSYWLEMPLWLLVLGGPGLLVSLVGGAVVGLADRTRGKSNPR